MCGGGGETSGSCLKPRIFFSLVGSLMSQQDEREGGAGRGEEQQKKKKKKKKGGTTEEEEEGRNNRRRDEQQKKKKKGGGTTESATLPVQTFRKDIFSLAVTPAFCIDGNGLHSQVLFIFYLPLHSHWVGLMRTACGLGHLSRSSTWRFRA